MTTIENLTPGDLLIIMNALHHFYWSRHSQFAMISQKGFRTPDGRAPTKEDIDKMAAFLDEIEKVQAKLPDFP